MSLLRVTVIIFSAITLFDLCYTVAEKVAEIETPSYLLSRQRRSDDDPPRESKPIATKDVRPPTILTRVARQTQSFGSKRGRSSNCDVTFRFNSTGQSAYLKSPRYPQSYPPNLLIKYCISSPTGTQMTLTCNDFNVEYQRTCSYDALSFSKSGDYSYKDGVDACGKGTFSSTTTGNQMPITFRSDNSNPYSYNNQPYRYQCVIRVTGNPSSPVTSRPEVTTTTVEPPNSGSTTNCTCGVRNRRSRIVGGTQAEPNEFPWRCYLKTKQYSFFCGCSVISKNWVMTAAHCTHAVMPLSSGDQLIVVVGASDRSKSSEPGRKDMVVDRIIQHPAYDPDSQNNDITLLHTAQPIEFSPQVAPVCLPWKFGSRNFSGETVTTSGWGTTSSGGQVSNKLMEVDLPVISKPKCQEFYGSSINDNMICTYEPGKDTCQGDSGGSIDFQDDNSQYYAIGIVSWGVGCAENKHPGVYTNVPRYLNFIETTTAGETFCKA